MTALLSGVKALALAGADVLTGAVGGPSRFTRAVVPDPADSFFDAMTRRDALAAAAEEELARFVHGGVFFAQDPNDLGDAAIWQGVYAAMTALRWHVRPTPASRKALQEAAEALSRYFYPTGPGESVLMRGAVPQALEGTAFRVDPTQGGHYFTDGYLGQPYVYRDDASLDSLLGAMFGAAIVQRFGHSGARSVLETPLESFAHAFEKDGYRLTNRDGSRTRHGDCRPGFFQAPVRTLAAALPSLMAGSPVAPSWRAIARAHAPEFVRTDTQLPGRVSWVNAHLAILANLAYVAAAPSDAPGIEHARAGVRVLLDKYADAGNAFLVHAARLLGVQPTQRQLDQADKILLEFPLGAKPRAGHYPDATAASQPVPVWQRPPSDIVWQRDPYQHRGSEPHAYTRLDYLIAHYCSRSA